MGSDALVPASADRYAAIVERARRRIADLARQSLRRRSLVPTARAEMKRVEPQLAAELRDAQLLAFLKPYQEQTAHLVTRPPDRRPPPVLTGGEPRGVVWPQVVKAVEYVRNRVPFTEAEFKTLDADAKRVAVTVAGSNTIAAVEAVKAAVADDIAKGGTLAEFRGRVADSLGASLGDHVVETTYRTMVGRAYTAGKVAVLDSPAVRSAVPYLLYSATHDSRVRPEHLAIETLGLDGTAVYRADDPVWDQFLPPWAWNCRCEVIPLSVRAAAGYGVREAAEWLRTGVPPAEPEYVKPFPFDVPAGWVPTGRRLSALV